MTKASSNNLDSKHQRELELLRLAYPATNYPDVVAGDKPDFVLGRDQQTFGVEVTEYYQNDTSGRFHNIPNYLTKLTEEDWRHKDDVGSLEAVSLAFENSDGTYTQFSGKMAYREIPTPSARIERLQQIVADKNDAHSGYSKEVTDIDLVIGDLQSELLAGVDGHRIMDYLRGQEAANSLESPFRNIVLVITETGRRPHVIYLKRS